MDKSILSIQNHDVDDLNMLAMKRFSRVLYIYFSTNITLIEDGANNANFYPTKYLNSLNLSKLLPFNLELKVRCPIMLLQDIALCLRPCNGLCFVNI